jgi:hypothetical protein
MFSFVINYVYLYVQQKQQAINLALKSLRRSRYLDKFYSQRKWLSYRLFVYLLKML